MKVEVPVELKQSHEIQKRVRTDPEIRQLMSMSPDDIIAWIDNSGKSDRELIKLLALGLTGVFWRGVE